MHAVTSLRRAKRHMSRNGVTPFRCAEMKRRASRRHRRARHAHERESRLDVDATCPEPKKLTGFDIVMQSRIW